MPRYSSQDIDHIVDTLRSAKDNGKPAHILFGAGCSKSAGIPLASEIVEAIHNKYPGYCQSLAEVDQRKYGACMKLLSPNQRRDLLTPFLTKASINWAHIALAQFLSTRFVERALTVNFDNLLARACGLLSLYPAIYDFGSAPTADVSVIVSPAIVHLHGQGHGVVLLNTEDETKTHSTKIAPVLRQSMERPLIVIGYSGATDDVLRSLREHYPGTEYLYWLSNSEDVNPAVREIADIYPYFKCVAGVDADRFLIELAQKLRCWPPIVCTNPIGHLLAELKPVTDYPTVPGNEVDILSAVRSRLAELEESEKQQEQTTKTIEKLLFEGRYEEAVSVFDAIPVGFANANQRRIGVAALILMGGKFYDEAQTANRTTAVVLLEQARAKCEAAQKIDPSDPMILYNVGVVLLEKASRTIDVAEAIELFKAAQDKYEAALAIKPDYHDALNNCGAALSGRARRVDGAAEALELFKAAEMKYEAALRIKADKHVALSNWGNALVGRARRTEDASEAVGLLKAAEAKYEAALLIKSDYHDALTNWGNALFARAELVRDADEAIEFFKAAGTKYEASLQIRSDDCEALNNLGNALVARARRVKDAAEAVKLFKEAEGKYEAALSIKTDQDEAMYNWAVALAAHAEHARDSAEAVELLKAAETKYEATLRIKSDKHEALFNWGNALAARAIHVNDAAESSELFKAAEEKYKAELLIKPDDYEALNNWGSALSARAMRANGAAKASELFRQAEAKYEAALRIKPDAQMVLGNWGHALLARAERCRDALEALELLKAAEGKYETALRISPDDKETLHAYGIALLQRAKRTVEKDEANDLLKLAAAKLKMAQQCGDSELFACAYALLDQVDDCRQTFEAAEKIDTLPLPDKLENDDDLQSVHRLTWFRELIERLTNKSV